MTVDPLEAFSFIIASEVDMELNSEQSWSSIICLELSRSEFLSDTVAQIGSLNFPVGERQMRFPNMKCGELSHLLPKEYLIKCSKIYLF